MEIQYAMFCKRISDAGTVLRQPITKIVVSDVKHFRKIRLPLLVTFFAGESGKHLLNVHIVLRGQDRYETTMDFHFDWPQDSIFFTKIFGLEFKPKFHGVYDFLFEVDGKILTKIPLPIGKGGT